jgi:hypothetical protein
MRRAFQPEENTMTPPSSALARNIWVGTMAGTSTIASLLLACATPFPSLAALAATQVPRRDGLVLMFVAWFAAQAVTFITHGYPAEPASMAWPFALGTAAVGSLLAAEFADRALGNAQRWLRTGGAYVGAFVGFKLGILLWVSLLDHGWAAFSGEVLLRQFVRNGAILAGLAAVQYLLERAGLRLGAGARVRAA